MASYLDKMQVNTAITDNTKLDLGHQHITSADFMQVNVATIHEMVPGSKIDVKMESFARLNPLPVPTFGRASMRNRAFFVPMRVLMGGNQWNDFITDSVHVASDGYNGAGNLVSSVPTIDMSDLCGAFLNSVTGSSTGRGLIYALLSTVTEFDFIYNGTKYNYTVMGRQALKLLEQLGYKLDYNAAKGDCVMSALPLLALCRVYCDWYYPQQYSNLTGYDRLLSLCRYDVHNATLGLTSTDVANILIGCSWVSYDSDYFVSAFDFPNQPNIGNYSNFKLVNIDSIGTLYGTSAQTNVAFTSVANGYVTNNSGVANPSGNEFIGAANAPFIGPMATYTTSQGASVARPAPISEYLLHGLHALTDYMKRHQLAGSRAFDRYLARFGKALPAEKIDRSVYLGAAMQDIQIGDVMSTADTVGASSGAQLGTYAGKGMSYGNGHFSYDTDEYGYFIVISSIVPAVGYFQGIDRQVMRTTKLQFWTPEFDSLGVQPITAAELYIPQTPGIMSSATGDPYTQIFGFTPRYADYKVSHDSLTGNMRLLSLSSAPFLNTNDSWHLMRSFNGVTDFNQDWSNVVHNPDFVSGGSDFSQYKRIFYDDAPDSPDNFTIIHNFEIAEYAPMKALYDSYEFEDKGKKVTLDVNGVKMN